MSDLNDLIATNAINSFNSGYLQGQVDEYRRITNLIKQMGSHANKNNDTNSQKLAVICNHLIALIEGEQK